MPCHRSLWLATGIRAVRSAGAELLTCVVVWTEGLF